MNCATLFYFRLILKPNCMHIYLKTILNLNTKTVVKYKNLNVYMGIILSIFLDNNLFPFYDSLGLKNNFQ